MPPPSPESPAPPLQRPWYLHPYLHVALSIVFSAAAQPFMKLGADASGKHEVLAIGALRSGWLWLGIISLVTSLLSWLYALRTVPLNIAYNLTGMTHVLVPLASWLFLAERVNGTRWAGIFLVTLGVAITAREAVKVESKL